MSCSLSTSVYSAPAKIILAGEHAVVYGAPAIAVPLPELRATAYARRTTDTLSVSAVDLQERIIFEKQVNSDNPHPLQVLMQLAVQRLDISDPTGEIVLRSDIPIASGLGSGASASAATVKAIAALYRQEFTLEEIDGLVYQVEKVYHGTPSGIDNTVVVYEKPVYFAKGEKPEIIQISDSFHFIVADTGHASPTRTAVRGVRRLAENEPARVNAIFERIGHVATDVKLSLERGNQIRLGSLMTQNHRLLQQLEVSSPELDRLIEASLTSGALGAKLCGGGLGGNMIALANAIDADFIKDSLLRAGAVKVFDCVLS